MRVHGNYPRNQLKKTRVFGERIHLFRVDESERRILCKKLRFQKTFRIIGFLVNGALTSSLVQE